VVRCCGPVLVFLADGNVSQIVIGCQEVVENIRPVRAEPNKTRAWFVVWCFPSGASPYRFACRVIRGLLNRGLFQKKVNSTVLGSVILVGGVSVAMLRLRLLSSLSLPLFTYLPLLLLPSSSVKLTYILTYVEIYPASAACNYQHP
jgi:hypothetical protein